MYVIDFRILALIDQTPSIDKNSMNHKEGNDYNVYPMDKMLRA